MSIKTYIHITPELETGTAKEDSKIESHCEVLITCANAKKIKERLDYEVSQLELQQCIEQITNYNIKIQGIIRKLDLFLRNTEKNLDTNLDTKRLANELFFTDLYNNSCYDNINTNNQYKNIFRIINELRNEIFSFDMETNKEILKH